MEIAKQYWELLKTYNRVMGQARRYGVDDDYSPVKRPTSGSIRRLQNVIEKIRTKLFIGRTERKYARREEELQQLSEAEVIVDNFRDFVEEVASYGYIAGQHGGVSFVGHGDTDRSVEFREYVRYKIYAQLDAAIGYRGSINVARSIQDHGEELYMMVEDMMFAIYNGKYSSWGGGEGALDAQLSYMGSILAGDTE